MLDRTARAMIGFALIVCVSACEQSKFKEADQCVFVDLQKDEGLKLMPTLDAFAQTNGLTPVKQLPVLAMYTLRTEGRKLALVWYAIGIDESGAQLALFRFDTPGSDRLAIAFEELVNHEISPRFGARRCAEVPGVALPTASN